MPTVPQLNINTFDTANPMRGDVSESITKSGILAGILTAGTAVAGDRVKLDSTVTMPGRVGFVLAADNEPAFGTVKRTVKNSSYDASSEDTNKIEVCFSGGQAVYQVGNGTLTPGTPVSMNAGFLDVVGGGRAQMGLLIDYVLSGSIGRVIVGWVPA